MTNHLERFNSAYDTLNGLGAADKGVDATAGLGFVSPDEWVSVMTSPDGHPREDGYRAIGWLMTDRVRSDMTAAKFTYLVNAFCSPDGEVTALYADKADIMELKLGTGLNHGYPMTERTPHDEVIGVESALLLIEQAVESFAPVR